MAIDFNADIDSLLADLSREAKFAKEAADLKEQHDKERKKEAPALPPTATLTKKVQPSVVEEVTLTKKRLPIVEEVSEVSADELAQSLFNTLANESRRITAEINGALGDLDVEITEEVSVELKKVPVVVDDDEEPEEIHDITYEEVESLVAQSAQHLATLEDVDYKPSADNSYIENTGQLAKRIEVMQNTLAQMTSVGWGQAGMTYGSGEVRLEFLDDVDRDSAKRDGYYLQYQALPKPGKWVGSVSTTGGWDPSGYEYTGDKTLETIVNEAGTVNGLEVEENTWTVMPCTGAVGATPGSEDNYLPSNFVNRIWNRSSNRFSFAELATDAVILFRVQTWLYPETNNALLAARIRFVAVGDGEDHVLNEDGDRIVLEDDTGNITGDFFQSYSFFQTVSAQEMADGAGVEHERTFIFPIYVGNAHAQRGYGQFELNCSCDFTLNDSSVVAVLN